MSKRGENIRKRKDGRWEGRFIKGYSESGKTLYGSIYAKSYNDVKQRLQEMIAGNGLLRNEKKTSKIKFADILSDWLEITKISIRESTYVKYHNAIVNHIIPDLGGLLLSSINNKRINRFIMKKHESGKIRETGGLSASTLKTIVHIIKAAIKYAIGENLINAFSIDIQLPSAKKDEIRVLNENEQAKLESQLWSEPDGTKLGVLICLYTGLRVGEICSLRWEDVDWEKKIIKVRSTVQRLQNFDEKTNSKTKLVIGTPKSRQSNREIPIPSFLMELLNSFLSGSKKGFVLTGNENDIIEPRTYQNRFKSYLKSAGLSDYNFHVLRHTFATRCVKIGFDPKTLSEILGHSSVNITLNRYVHSSFDMKRNQMELLSTNRGQYSGQVAM